MLKKLNIYFIALGLMLLCFNLNAQNIDVAGVKYNKHLNYNEQKLVLNGAGVKSRWIFNLYTAGLYIPKKNNNAQQVMDCDCPTVLRIVIVTSLISVSYFHSEVDKWFDEAMEGKTKHLLSRIEQFKAAFGESVNKYDDVMMYYTPGIGIEIYKNGKYMDVIKGLDFKQALSKLWLGEKTRSPELKNALLGK